MKYGACSLPSGTAVIATGCKQAAGFDRADAQDSCPCANPEVNVWLAATVAAIALSMFDPPAVPSNPPRNVFEYGGLIPTRSTTLPGKISLNIPNPVRSTVFEAACQAIAVRGCMIANGVDAKIFPKFVSIEASSG